MRPHRSFRFRGKNQVFAVVGFRYDAPSSIDYQQFKMPDPASALVRRLLEMEEGAEVISIRRIYLTPDTDLEKGTDAYHAKEMQRDRRGDFLMTSTYPEWLLCNGPVCSEQATALCQRGRQGFCKDHIATRSHISPGVGQRVIRMGRGGRTKIS
jgi:hypothetical protein